MLLPRQIERTAQIFTHSRLAVAPPFCYNLNPLASPPLPLQIFLLSNTLSIFPLRPPSLPHPIYLFFPLYLCLSLLPFLTVTLLSKKFYFLLSTSIPSPRYPLLIPFLYMCMNREGEGCLFSFFFLFFFFGEWILISPSRLYLSHLSLYILPHLPLTFSKKRGPKKNPLILFSSPSLFCFVFSSLLFLLFFYNSLTLQRLNFLFHFFTYLLSHT